MREAQAAAAIAAAVAAAPQAGIYVATLQERMWNFEESQGLNGCVDFYAAQRCAC